MSERTKRILALSRNAPIYKFFDEEFDDNQIDTDFDLGDDPTFLPSTSDSTAYSSESSGDNSNSFDKFKDVFKGSVLNASKEVNVLCTDYLRERFPLKNPSLSDNREKTNILHFSVQEFDKYIHGNIDTEILFTFNKWDSEYANDFTEESFYDNSIIEKLKKELLITEKKKCRQRDSGFLENSTKEECFYNTSIIKNLKEVFSVNENKKFVREGKPRYPIREVTNKVSNILNSSFLTSNKYKKTICKFCENKIVSKHFARHLERNHADEREVKEIFYFEAKSKERKKVLTILRNEGKLQSGIHGQIIPKKYLNSVVEINQDEYAICIYCKGYYKRLCLSRHVKKCFAKPLEGNPTSKGHSLTESLVYSVCQKKYGDILNKLAVKKEIFNKMQADLVTETAIGDLLIAFFGEDLLKKNKNNMSLYHLSNKLRECGKFVLEMKKLGAYPDMLSTLKPDSFDNAIVATKKMSRFDTEKRSFGAASLALHFGTTLKKLSDLALKLILREKIPLFVQNVEKTLTDLERFKKIVESQWTTELGSLALKDLTEKSATRPKLLPITEDVIKLKNLVENLAEQAYNQLKISKTIKEYRTLVETTLVSTILHNRKRVGDIQYLDLNYYKEQLENVSESTVQTELSISLSENEKMLTQNYKRIVAIGKGSRPVTILIPKNLQKYFSMVYNLRKNSTWFLPENTYFFTYPKLTKWIDGCSVIRKYAKMSEAKHPELLTSCRLRKHIATVTQLLSLKGNEIDQLAKFMGHTTKTHEQFYKLPQDIYQVAKVSKILQLMEKGNAAEFKNKSLDEIDIDMETIDLETDYCDINYPVTNQTALNAPTYQNTESSNLLPNYYEENLKVDSNITSNLADNAIRSTVTNTKKKGSRQRWNESQNNIMRQYFKENIEKKKALKKKQCQEFLEKYPEEFKGVGWIRVKTFIFNVYRLNSNM